MKINVLPGTKPIAQRPYRVPVHLEPFVNQQIQEMLDNNIIAPPESSWASPIILVKKKDGSWRFVVDYRKLNTVIEKDVYPIPLIDDMFKKLKDAKYFTSLDLMSGYWQIKMDED